MFTPARLEKLKQPEFMSCVVEILKNNPDAHFKWTGYFPDEEVVNFFRKNGMGKRNTYIPWMDERRLKEEINDSYAILACFPLSLGTVENIAAECGVPILAMFDDEKNLYWRDVYWEAINGNKYLADICLNPDGSSKIDIVKTCKEYIASASRIISDKKMASEYAEVYKKAYDYTYNNNPNDIGGMLSGYINNLN